MPCLLAKIVAAAVIFVKPLSEYNFVIITYYNRKQFSILFRKIKLLRSPLRTIHGFAAA